MQDFKYKTSFSSKILTCSSLESNDWLPWNITEASLDSLKTLMPKSIELDKNIDLLGVAFNGAVVNRFNKNGDGISTDTALAIKDYFVHKPTNIEHERQKVVGHVVSSAFSEFGTNKLLNDFEAAGQTGPFNIALAAVVYKTVNRPFATLLENAEEEDFGEVVSASWEIGFNDYAIALGSKNLGEAEIITAPEQIKEFDEFLLSNGGSGKTEDGQEVYRLVKGEVYPLGIGFTTNPAAEVKGLVTVDQKDNETISYQKQENSSHFNQSVVNTEKQSNAMENQQITEKLEQILDNKLSEQKYAEETVANIVSVISDAIKEKSAEYVEDCKRLEEEKQQLSKAEEEFKSSVAELQQKLESTETQLAELQQEKSEREAQARFNDRMEILDETYELEDEDRKVLAAEVSSLDESEESFASLQEKLTVMWRHKDKSYIKEQQEVMEAKVNEEVEKRLQAFNESKASVEDAPESESTEEILENAEVEEEVITNNNGQAAKQEASLTEQFRAVFNRENVNIKY